MRSAAHETGIEVQLSEMRDLIDLTWESVVAGEVPTEELQAGADEEDASDNAQSDIVESEK